MTPKRRYPPGGLSWYRFVAQIPLLNQVVIGAIRLQLIKGRLNGIKHGCITFTHDNAFESGINLGERLW